MSFVLTTPHHETLQDCGGVLPSHVVDPTVNGWSGFDAARLAVRKKFSKAHYYTEARYVGDFVSFFYGACEALDDGECAAPVEIQDWNVCSRWRDLIDISPDASLTIRGVPARFFEGYQRLELYTASVTIVIFGDTQSQLLTIANALVGYNSSGRAMAPDSTAPLTMPSNAALSGGLSCQPQ